MPLLFKTKTVKKGNDVITIEKSKTPYALPTTFLYDNFNVSSDYFLRYTNTSALLVLKNNELLYENYFPTQEDDENIPQESATNNNLFIAWSISKSFVSTLAGIAIQEGYIKSIDELVVTYVPELRNTAYEKVTIKQLLQMTSGVKFNEDYDDFFSDINIFSYYLALGLNTNDYISTLKENDHSGKHQYTSIDTQVLARVISKTTGRSLNEYLSEKIWQPLGMEQDAAWITDAYGNEFAAGGLNALPRDYARFGLLIANHGQWQDKHIIASEWIKNIGAENQIAESKESTDYDYSYKWWIPKDTKENEMLAIGIYDQYIYINRDKNIVIVKLSANANYISDDYISESQSLLFFRKISDSL